MLIILKSPSLFIFFSVSFLSWGSCLWGHRLVSSSMFLVYLRLPVRPTGLLLSKPFAFSRVSSQTWISEMSEFLMRVNYFQLHSSFFCSYLNKRIDFPAVLLHWGVQCHYCWNTETFFSHAFICPFPRFFFFSCVQLPSICSIRS